MRLNTVLFEKLTILIVIGVIIKNYDSISITMQIINIFDTDTVMRIRDSTILIGSTLCLLVGILFVELFDFPNVFLANIFTKTNRISVFIFTSNRVEETKINKKFVPKKNKK